MPGRERQLVHRGPRSGEPDRTHPAGGCDLVHGPDHRQDRGLDVGQAQQPAADHEPSLEHPVVGDELAQEVGHRGAGPGYPAVGFEKAPLALAPQQGLAVVELEDELEPVAG